MTSDLDISAGGGVNQFLFVKLRRYLEYPFFPRHDKKGRKRPQYREYNTVRNVKDLTAFALD